MGLGREVAGRGDDVRQPLTPVAASSLCRTPQNTFNTLKDMRIVFVDGTVLDTSDASRCVTSSPWRARAGAAPRARLQCNIAASTVRDCIPTPGCAVRGGAADCEQKGSRQLRAPRAFMSRVRRRSGHSEAAAASHTAQPAQAAPVCYVDRRITVGERFPPLSRRLRPLLAAVRRSSSRTRSW